MSAVRTSFRTYLSVQPIGITTAFPPQNDPPDLPPFNAKGPPPLTPSRRSLLFSFTSLLARAWHLDDRVLSKAESVPAGILSLSPNTSPGTTIQVLFFPCGEAPSVRTIENTLQAEQVLVGGLITTLETGVDGTIGIAQRARQASVFRRLSCDTLPFSLRSSDASPSRSSPCEARGSPGPGFLKSSIGA